MARPPKNVMPAHSHKCLMKGGVLWCGDTIFCECSSQLLGKQQSSTFSQTKASPSCRFQSFLSPTSGAKRSSSPLFMTDSNFSQESLVLVKEVFLLEGLSYFPKSISLSHQTANKLIPTEFRTTVRKAISSTTLSLF